MNITRNKDTSRIDKKKEKILSSRFFTSRFNFNSSLKLKLLRSKSKTRSNQHVNSNGHYPLDNDNDASSSSSQSNDSGTVIMHAITHEIEQDDQQQQSSPTTSYNQKQLCRLEELKRLKQQRQSESLSSSLESSLSLPTLILFPTPPSFLQRIQLSSQWIAQLTEIQKKLMNTMEDKTMTWIDGSPFRLILTTLFFMIISYWMSLFGYGIIDMATYTHNAIPTFTTDTVMSGFYYDWSWLIPPCYYCFTLAVEIVIIVTTMSIKLFLLSMLYNWILDIILISTFDCMDIPLAATAFANRNHDHNQTQNTLKNPNTRKYAIRNIRTTTSYVTMKIIICGLFMSIVRSIFYHVLNMFHDRFFNKLPLSSLPLSASVSRQCIDFVQSSMMYIGVFLLTFHLILVHNHHSSSSRSTNS